MTPFSGLSLIFHLGIIAISSTAGFFGFTRKRTKGHQFKYPRMMSILNPMISVAILVAIGSVSLSFIATALTTGLIVGADEPQREFVTELFD